MPTDAWVEIDYSAAAASTAPAWSFSNTPGWTAADWAPSGSGYPQASDVFNSVSIEQDAIGTCAILDSGDALQIMIGPAGLESFSSVIVHIEGRSVSTSTAVTFDVYNPVSQVGASASLGEDWTLHSIDIDLGPAIVLGEDLQAIRICPTGGSSCLALQRMRITVKDALW